MKNLICVIILLFRLPVLSQEAQPSFEYSKWESSVLNAMKSFATRTNSILVARDTVFLNWVSGRKFDEMKNYMHICDSSWSDTSFILFHVNQHEIPSCTVTFLPISHKKAKCILTFTSTEFQTGPIRLSERDFSVDKLANLDSATANIGTNTDRVYITRFGNNTVSTAFKHFDEESRSDFEKVFGNIW
ncbi:MAG: hypothetical protein JNM41_02175 [Flavipsychrobacter sp.]|nr:hypothetical protein [Flavipsychrobacter sp.]